MDKQLDRDLDLVLNALEFYQLAVGEGLSIENGDGHTNEPDTVFAEYFEASGLPDEDGNYDAIPKRIYDRLKGIVSALGDCPLPSTLGNVDTHYQRFYDWHKRADAALSARQSQGQDNA